MRTYLNKKGSAMVLVLSSLIILMAVSAVVVMLSAANISMSRQYSNWSADYYWLDYAAQDQLGDLDKQVLITGENIARYYLQNSYYKYPAVYEEEGAEGFPYGTGMPTTMVTAFSDALWLQKLIYDKWNEIYSVYAAIPVPTEEEEEAYNESIQSFVSDLFEVLYFAYLDGNLSIADYEDTEHGVLAETTLQTANWFPNPNDESIESFDAFCDLVTESPRLAVHAWEDSGENPKQVNVQITVIPPSFTAVQQTRYYAIKANPLYANALSVRGNITFTGSGSATVQGDVVSSNQTGAGASQGLYEGNEKGIKTQRGSSVNVNIYGNVYSAGDVHLWGDSSSISVRPYAPGYTPSVLKANYLYSSGNEYYFDFAATQSHVPDYTEGHTEANVIPYIYRDNAGGNVYCNNLAIEDSIQNGSLRVFGALWTQDDIQNDGKIGSAIQVTGNYIGMRSDANESNRDPNGSSAVINNGYMYGSTIALDGSYIIPGTAWYEFSDDYYQTAESATARAGEYFGIYEKSLSDMDGTSDDASKVFGVYAQDSDQYTMYERQAGSADSGDILRDRVNRFKAAMAAGLKSGISVNGAADNYTLGIVNNDGEVVYDQGYERYLKNRVQYSSASGGDNLLDDVFTAKTENYGTNGFGFSALIDPAAAMNDPIRGFHYYSGNATVDVDDISSGILYCSGNLTLTGSGTFTGSVICAGNLVFSSGVSVVYDESAVLSVLGFTAEYQMAQTDGGGYLGSSIARRFFSPSSYDASTTLGIEQVTTLSTSAGEREGDNLQRYVINSWKESQVD